MLFANRGGEAGRETPPRVMLTLPLSHRALAAHILAPGEFLKLPLHGNVRSATEQKIVLWGPERARASLSLRLCGGSRPEGCWHTRPEQDSEPRNQLLFKQDGRTLLSSESRTLFFTPDGLWGACHSRCLCERHGSVLVEWTHGRERKGTMESRWLFLWEGSGLGVVS